jgi:hypothetical protein
MKFVASLTMLLFTYLATVALLVQTSRVIFDAADRLAEQAR